eukprot:1196363-Prorocentrum_minimum.AAC.4
MKSAQPEDNGETNARSALPVLTLLTGRRFALVGLVVPATWVAHLVTRTPVPRYRTARPRRNSVLEPTPTTVMVRKHLELYTGGMPFIALPPTITRP